MFEKILSEHHLTSVKKVAAAALEYKKENNVSMVVEFTTDLIKNSVRGDLLERNLQKSFRS